MIMRWNMPKVLVLVLLSIWTCTSPRAEPQQNEPTTQQSKKDDKLIKEIRLVLATKINVQQLKEGAEVYTDRLVTVERLPDELAEWTLIVATKRDTLGKTRRLMFLSGASRSCVRGFS